MERRIIARHWRGIAKPDAASAYIDHLRAETFPALRELPGFIDAAILRRDVPQGVEFLVVTHWISIDAIRAFAGDPVDIAVVPTKVEHMMVEYDRMVRHYEVAEAASQGAA
ncbi:antibiotic biosynthesis monooxygenase [Piscinibacter sp. XHJ-5]|uniref:antibiotic biosynthesis monooxygenase n=1 Tax=Piscinibacter sp. XHJ-5 TaxID=3037797 RepID=UPI0024529F7B|nr:antibiotic biosynthesis monooxygenase [Piscinibacter sp. XHJ-5]